MADFWYGGAILGLFRVRLVVVDSSLPDRNVYFEKGTSVLLSMTTELRNCRENMTRIFVYIRGQAGVFKICSWTATNNTCEVSCDLAVTKLRYGMSLYVSALGGSAIHTQFLNLYCSQKGRVHCTYKSY